MAQYKKEGVCLCAIAKCAGWYTKQQPAMEIHQTATTGIALKFVEGTVAINPPEKKSKGQSPILLLSTYPVPVGDWTQTLNTDTDNE